MNTTFLMDRSKIYFFIIFLFLSINSLNAQNFKVLIFHKTAGFRHADGITEGIKMITTLGNTNGWSVDNTQNSADFNTVNLAKYKVVIWANTSGDNLLNAAERTAFEGFIQRGGGFVGIHAATDTYRNKSWPWYNDLVGAIVQTNPNHTANNFSGTMDVLNTGNTLVNHLGTTWSKKEEWYYWELNGGYLFNGNINLLQVRSTGSNSYDKARPTTWYKQYKGGRSFYTALGHNGTDYVANSSFGDMIRKAILWAANNTSLGFEQYTKDNDHLIYPNPSHNYTTIEGITENSSVEIIDLLGKTVTPSVAYNNEKAIINLNDLQNGVYTITFKNSKGEIKSQKVIKE
jgi:uncharacterized protein